MSVVQADDTTLTWQVFTSKRAGLTRDLPAGLEQLDWVANSSTLISGKQDAVLVDTLLTIDQSRALTDWIAASGKTLTAIYITHGHGDHFFGLSSILERFPQARAFAIPEVVAAMKLQLTSERLDGFWRPRFPGQISDRLTLAEPLDGNELKLEGHNLIAVNTGATDTEHSSSLYVPSIGLIVAGDVVYNGIHPFLAETDVGSRLNWISALDKLEALKPRAAVAGHKIPTNDDDPRCIAATRQYILDFNRLDEATTSARELYDAMLALYPDRVNPGSLWRSAHAAKRT